MAARSMTACSRVSIGPPGREGLSLRKLGLALILYVLTYIGLRMSWSEVWIQDQQTYVIFPLGAEWAYYLFRPLAYVDGALTGLRFHIGPHQ